MKRMLSLILCAVLILGLTGCQKKEKNPFETSGDFRKTTWGMTRDEVKALETAELTDETEKSISYNGQVGKYAEVSIIYYFNKDQLTHANYIFSQKNDDGFSYVENFDQIKEELSEVYGPPELYTSNWENEPKSAVPEDQMDSMIAKGELTYFAQWKTEKTEVNFGMYGSNGKITTGISYRSEEFAAMENSYEPDTTGYQPARSHQDYLDFPTAYENQTIYKKGKISDLSFDSAIFIKDENGKPWVAIEAYPLTEERKILQEGDEVTVFGLVGEQGVIKDVVTILLFKIDKDGQTIYCEDKNGMKLENTYFVK